MNRVVILRPRAENDILDIEAYLFEESPPSADRFVLAVAATAKRLAVHPGMGSPRHFESKRLMGVRLWPVEGFSSHLIVYQEVLGGIELLRVIHAARDISRFVEDIE